MTGARAVGGALLCLSLGVLAPGSALAATTYYTAPAGTGNACTQEAPCEVTVALGSAVAGDTVMMAGDRGTYGTSGSPLTTSIEVPNGVTLTGDPSQPMPIVYSATEAPTYTGVKLEGGSTRLSDLDVRYTGAGQAVSASGSLDRVIAEGGCFFGFSDTLVTNSLCEGNYGIYENVGGGGAWKVTLRNTTIVGGTEAIALFSNGPSVTFELFNTIVHTSGGGVDISGNESGAGYVWLSANNSDFATASALNGAHVETPGTNVNQTAAPQFVDPGTGDYAELASSPTVGGGLDEALNGNLDLAGNPREIAGRTDIGAYEFVYPPVLTVLAPAAITSSAAKVNATINPNGVATSYHLDYGTGSGYGSSTAPQQLAAATTPLAVSIGLSGLHAATTYHYRVVAESSGGTTTGADQSLTTEPPPVGHRPSNAFTVGKVKKLKLSVIVASKGTVQVRAIAPKRARVGARRKAATLKLSSASGGPGAVKVPLRLSPSTRAALKRKATLRLRALVTFTPDGGEANSKAATLELKGRR